MRVTEPLKKGSSLPQIVRLDNALKLAEVWVNQMSKTEDDEPVDADKEGRPSRLGLGAKVVRQFKVAPSDDPVDRKLYAKLTAGKRKAAQLEEEYRSQKHGVEDDDEDVDEDSRSSSFMKKAAPRPFPSMILGNKKRK